MPSSRRDEFDVLVIGAGPAGVIAALRAARLGARTALVTCDAFGGMAANDGPVPVRTLAHAARLLREARQLRRYGIDAEEPSLDYSRLLARVREVTDDVRARSLLPEELERAGVTIHEHAGIARFVDPQVIESENAPRLRARKVIICTGGVARPLAVPGFDLTGTHSDAWRLASAPESMLVIGAGATGVQVASIFGAFGSRVTLFEAAPRILMSEDDDVASAMSTALQASGLRVLEDAGTIDRFEKCPAGVRLVYSKNGAWERIDATVAVVAVGWIAKTDGLDLDAAGVQTDPRGYIQVDSRLRTSAPNIFAAGDVTGHVMVVHEAAREAYLAATNAVLGRTTALPAEVSPLGSFTDPEYASVGLTEATARDAHDVVVATERFDSLPRPIIDGHPSGFCKLIADRKSHTILGCHIVGERAVELAQLAAVAMAGQMKVERLALVPFSFPTYANALARAAIRAARQLGASDRWVEDRFVEEVEATHEWSEGVHLQGGRRSDGMTSPEAVAWSETPGLLSEGPRWHEERQELLWVDVLGCQLHRGRLAADGSLDQLRTMAVDRHVGAVAPVIGGGYVLAAGPGFLFVDEAGSVQELAQPEAGRTDVRMNDGACDPQGRFWAGTMAYDESPGAGSLYRLELDGTCTTVLTGLTISNGIGWSPDGKTMYLNDSGTGCIETFRFQESSGAVTERRTLVRIEQPGVAPDGLTVDEDGGIWVALWGGGVVNRYAPDGTVLTSLRLPVERPTSCAFGGPDRATLFVTTARAGLDDAARARQPESGHVFSIVGLGIRGLPCQPYRGRITPTGVP